MYIDSFTLHADTPEAFTGACFVKKQCHFKCNITCKHSKSLLHFPTIHLEGESCGVVNYVIWNSLLHIHHTQDGKELLGTCSN